MKSKPSKSHTRPTMSGTTPYLVSFNRMIDQDTARALMVHLAQAVNNGHDEIHLMLSSDGGLNDLAIATYNTMRALPVRLITYNMGVVNSAANVVFQGGENRVCVPRSSFMFHGSAFDIQNERLDIKGLREKQAALENVQRVISGIISDRSKVDTERINRMFLEQANILPEEALSLGLIDDIGEVTIPSGIQINYL